MNKKLLRFPSFFFAVSLICGILGFSATAVSAQANASVAPGDPIATEALPQSQWKSVPEYAAVIVAERTSSALQLASPAIKEVAQSNFNAYDRMLSYMQVDLGAGVPIEEIADKNFKRVVLEIPSEPAFANVYMAEFFTMYDALVVMLRP